MRHDNLLGNKNLKNSYTEYETLDYSIIADDIPALLCRFNKEGKILFANKAYAKFLGKTKEEIINSRFNQTIS